MTRARSGMGRWPAPCDDKTLAAAWLEGKQGLKAEHRALVDLPVRCSVDYDSALKGLAPNANRWDYFVLPTARTRAIAIEVHPAKASEVDRLIRKRKESEKVLEARCPKLGIESWHWLLPNKSVMALTRGSPQARRLALAGILFPKRRLTEKDL